MYYIYLSLNCYVVLYASLSVCAQYIDSALEVDV
jgi:hypothetical protein